jgi:hypothetical protein
MAQETMTIFMLLDATPQWLALSRQQRTDYYQHTIMPIFARFSASIKLRLFDSEYFNARVSDILLLETTSMSDYRLLIEMLRDTEIYSVPYFLITDIIPAKENGFREADEVLIN